MFFVEAHHLAELFGLKLPLKVIKWQEDLRSSFLWILLQSTGKYFLRDMIIFDLIGTCYSQENVCFIPNKFITKK
jgi:hypothetical protein